MKEKSRWILIFYASMEFSTHNYVLHTVCSPSLSKAMKFMDQVTIFMLQVTL